MFLKALLFLSLVSSVVLYLKLRSLQERVRLEIFSNSRLLAEKQLFETTLKSTRAHLDQVYTELELIRQRNYQQTEESPVDEPVMDPGSYIEVS